MTREEAIKIIEVVFKSKETYKYYDSVSHQALNMAIEALSAEPQNDDLIIKGAKGIQDGLYNIKDGKLFMYKAKGGTVRTYPIVPSADAISREEYEDIIKDYRKQYENMNNEIADLEAKLSAEAVQGKWNKLDTGIYLCSKCNWAVGNEYNYCPCCGARMKRGDEADEG